MLLGFPFKLHKPPKRLPDKKLERGLVLSYKKQKSLLPDRFYQYNLFWQS